MSEVTDGAERAAHLFARTFGAPPTVVASAPGRVNLIGEHLDYNGGEVLPIAVAQRTYVAARANGGDTVRAISASESEAGEFSLVDARPARAWWDYVAGIATFLRAHGTRVSGADVAVWSDLPAGAGLGSSGALAVAAGQALAQASGSDSSLRDLAWTAREAEERFVGVAAGIMDQLASALGAEDHALHIRCETGNATAVPFTDSVLVFDTGVRRALRDGRFNARREECAQALALLRRAIPALHHLAGATPDHVRDAKLPPPLDARARHVATEMRRVRETVTALSNGAPLPGRLLFASHDSLRDDYACSCVELDWFVERAREAGLRGARLTGAGWGGCAIALDDADALARIAPAIAEEFRAVHGRKPRWWITRASAGAGFSPYPRR